MDNAKPYNSLAETEFLDELQKLCKEHNVHIGDRSCGHPGAVAYDYGSAKKSFIGISGSEIKINLPIDEGLLKRK